ncbi:phosphate ABC transporter permease PstA [Nitrogeniibacter mangrovi]|uniref:Phosphate transport system permease protein PstA n=1 Tax=Nitrogeniibacter mangrovi TaxID=2016596 RepID=A0A6C1B8J1_9RHOO|nr:phosphate ABC transporter permease PstA [Nitrogeniibacter mangrovi]QID18660.1 phosphate ABC transporter permease PstA [Nitrogeniibacter mangrovi]
MIPSERGLLLRRRLLSGVDMLMSVLATVFAVLFLGWLLWGVVTRGVSALNLALFTESTPGAGIDGGGLANAIVGSFLMTGAGIVLAALIGILAAVWLVEMAPGGALARAIRFFNDVLLAGPSIIAGVFVYGVLVRPMGHFSGWAGAAALAVVALPVVVSTACAALELVPGSLREASAALGAPRWRTTLQVVLRASRSGILTGLLLATARIFGEAAPLLFTSLGNNFFTWNMNQPVAGLPQVLYLFATGPYDNWHQLAWAGALVSTAVVLGLLVIARLVSRHHD